MDRRLAKRLEFTRILLAKHQTVHLRPHLKGHTEEMGFYRLLRNKNVTEEALVEALKQNLVSMDFTDRSLLVIADSSDIDYSRQRRRIQPDSGLGPIGNDKGYGYNVHINLAFDADHGGLYGIPDVQLWSRQEGPSATRQLRQLGKRRRKLVHQYRAQGTLSKAQIAERQELECKTIQTSTGSYRSSYALPLEARESHRWQTCITRSRSCLRGARQITYVHDREGDIFDTLVLAREENEHLLIRSKSNRVIQTLDGQRKYLHDYRHELEELGYQDIEIQDPTTGKKRHARIGIKSAKVHILREKSRAAYHRHYPASVEMNVVYAEEMPQTVPAGEAPVFWCLLTTHAVDTLEQAIQIVKWYAQRWWIELFFRLIKKSGFQLESSELETGYALRKLGILTMEVAVQVLQLKQAREGDQSIPIEAVFSPAEIECLEAISPRWNGNTEKQKNPFPKRTLPWAAWLISRMGGWKGYKNNRPPGVLTIRRGLDHFNLIFIGYSFSSS